LVPAESVSQRLSHLWRLYLLIRTSFFFIPSSFRHVPSETESVHLVSFFRTNPPFSFCLSLYTDCLLASMPPPALSLITSPLELIMHSRSPTFQKNRKSLSCRYRDFGLALFLINVLRYIFRRVSISPPLHPSLLPSMKLYLKPPRSVPGCNRLMTMSISFSFFSPFALGFSLFAVALRQ